MKFIAIEIDDDLHTKFKEWCARNKTTMKQEVTNFIEEMIKKEATK